MESLICTGFILHAVILAHILLIKCQELGKFTKLPFIRPLEDTNHVILRWQYTETDIMFEVSMPTLGIVGLGIARDRDNSSMFPADIALGWVQDGLVYLAFEAVFDSEHQPIIHHQFLMGCKLPDGLEPSRFHGETFECAEHLNFLLRYCGYVIFSWGIGMEPFFYPDHMGVSFGGTNDPELFILQSHYHNHTNAQTSDDRDDSSGIRITLTRKLRQYDAGTLHVGHMPSPSLLIPPGEPNFLTSSDCPSSCIDWGLGSNGTIKIAAVFIHTHERGTSVRVKVIRNGLELPWLAYDKHYSFRHQYTRLLTQEFTLQKGGYRKNDEMCIATLIYYPRKSLDTCLTWPIYDQLRNTLNQPIPPQYALSFLSTVNWRNDLIMRRNFRIALNTSAQTSLCTSLDLPERVISYTFRPVLIRRPYAPPSTCIDPVLLTHQ
ncbi:hypothetical protein ACJMK2_039238 [Sinanodonta woodiana]|uniref:DOMON domain-containing protein n=1 Tax=Sinanodonta woodiana TaxID=1069815 RepID=A0ABD3WCG9_SINWO